MKQELTPTPAAKCSASMSIINPVNNDMPIASSIQIFREMDCENIAVGEDSSPTILSKATPISDRYEGDELHATPPFKYSTSELELHQEESKLSEIPTELSCEWMIEEDEDMIIDIHPIENFSTAVRDGNENTPTSIYSFYFEPVSPENTTTTNSNNNNNNHGENCNVDDFTISSHGSDGLIEDDDLCLETITTDPKAFWEIGVNQGSTLDRAISPTQVSLGSDLSSNGQ